MDEIFNHEERFLLYLLCTPCKHKKTRSEERVLYISYLLFLLHQQLAVTVCRSLRYGRWSN